MNIAEEFLEKVILMDSSRNEVMVPSLDPHSELAKFLDYKSLPYEKRPQIESARFSCGALRGMVILRTIDLMDDTSKKPKVMKRSYVLVVHKVRGREKQPTRFSVKRKRDKDHNKINKYYPYYLGEDNVTTDEILNLNRC